MSPDDLPMPPLPTTSHLFARRIFIGNGAPGDCEDSRGRCRAEGGRRKANDAGQLKGLAAQVRGPDIVAQRQEADHPARRRRLHHQPAEKGVRPAGMASAIEALMLVSRSGSTMLVQIAVMKALNRHVELLFDPERKVTHH